MIGYKCFNKDLTNCYGKKFCVGKLYVATGNIRYGIDGNGYHMCKNMEDTFHFFPAMEEEVAVAQVNGSGKILERTHSYWDGLYVVQKLEILKVLTREEIIQYGLNLYPIQVEKFIMGFRLTPEEILQFKEKFKREQRILEDIAYYQEGDKEVFSRNKVFSKTL